MRSPFGRTSQMATAAVAAWMRAGTDAHVERKKRCEYHVCDQRFALVLFKRVPVLTHHGIHRFLMFFCWILVENSTRKDVPRGRIEQAKHWTN